MLPLKTNKCEGGESQGTRLEYKHDSDEVTMVAVKSKKKRFCHNAKNEKNALRARSEGMLINTGVTHLQSGDSVIGDNKIYILYIYI